MRRAKFSAKKFFIGSVAAIALAGTVHAADLPASAAPAPAPLVSTAYDWSGAYVGLQAGYGWGVSTWLFTGGDFAPLDPDGAFGGIYAGYNYHHANGVVIGVDADINFSGMDGGSVYFNPAGVPFPPTDRAESEIDWHGALRARLGYASNRWLAYLAGGLAVADYQWERFTPGSPYADDDTFVGYTVGGGIEYAFNNNLVARAEYRFSDFGDERFVAPGGITQDYDIDLEVHDVRLGIAYKFGP